MYELDHQDLSTFRNQPAPRKPRDFDRELAALGGLNRHGEPHLRVVWGQEAKTFAYDDYHLKYLAARWRAEKASHLYRSLTTGETRATTRAEAEEKYDRDPEWLYINKDICESVEVGLPRWIVEAWIPAEAFGSPACWEAHRYEWSRDERSGLVRKYDVLGPYPTRGEYLEVFTVETADGKFRPLGEDVLAELKRRIERRENSGPLDSALELKRAGELEAARLAKSEREFADCVADEIRPHAHRLVGNPRVAMVCADGKKQNSITKFGKARKRNN